MNLFRNLLALFLSSGTGLLAATNDCSYLSLKPFCARADGAQTCAAVVKVFTDTGVPAAGQWVTLVSSRGAADVIGPANPQLTDSKGEVRFTLRSSVRGASTLTAQCNGQTLNKGIIQDGAVGLWSFEGDAQDLSGRNNHGTLQNGPTFVTGKHGRAISLDGLSQYVSVAHNDSLNNRQAWSIDAWLYLNSLPGTRSVILQKSSSSGGDFYLSISNKTARARCATRGGADELNKYAAETANNVLSTGKWMHLVAVWAGSKADPLWDDGTLRIFVDGVQKKCWDIARYLCRNQSQPLNLGRDPAGGDFFQGLLDEVKLYDRPLYPPEIQRSYNFATTVYFDLEPPSSLTARTTQPECVILSWPGSTNANVTTYRIYRSTSVVSPVLSNRVDEIPCAITNWYDWNVDYGVTYRYLVTACSFTNESSASVQVAATPVKAVSAPGWYGGDTHVHSTNSWDVWYHTPAELASQAKAQGFDFLFITDHNSVVSRHEVHASSTASFLGLAGEEVSLSTAGDNDHFNAFFINRYVPGDGAETDLHDQVRAQGGFAQPNHCGYYTESTNIDGLEVVHAATVKWDTVNAWDWYLKQGFKLMGRGSTDDHGDAGKITTLLWLERLSWKELYSAFKYGRACAVTGPGIDCMLKVNGTMLGDTLAIDSGRSLTLELTAHSSTNITKMELVKYGTVVWSSVPNSPNVSRTYTDVSGVTNTYYRLQVQDAAGKWALGGAVYVQYQPPQPSVSLQVSAGPGGSISPAGLISVPLGGATNFLIAALPDYRIDYINTNRVRLGLAFNNQSTNFSYTWSNIVQNGSLTANFTSRLTSNGIPFTWLAQHSLSNRLDSVEQEDPDHDGFVNLQEWCADSDPTNAASTPPSLGIRRTQLGAPELFVDLTSTGRVYSLWNTTELRPGAAWLSNYSCFGTSSNIVFPAAVLRGPGFYRLGVSVSN
jgi:predicted metal-dependent phosphoesterase TrpH